MVSALKVFRASDVHIGEGFGGVLIRRVEVGANEGIEELKFLVTSSVDSVNRLMNPLQFSMRKASELRHVRSVAGSMSAPEGIPGVKWRSMLSTVYVVEWDNAQEPG